MENTSSFVMLLASDMDQSVGFYRKVFNIEPSINSPRWAQFNLNYISVCLHYIDSWSDENDPLRSFGVGQKGNSFGLFVDNLDEIIENLKSTNTEIKYGPRQTGLGKLIYISDPDGYHIQICENIKK